MGDRVYGSIAFYASAPLITPEAGGWRSDARQRQRPGPGAPASGHGIGLSTCLRIVDRHGGEIRVEENPGGGTAFIFTLPH